MCFAHASQANLPVQRFESQTHKLQSSVQTFYTNILLVFYQVQVIPTHDVLL